uniref:Sorting nexin 15 n=1 Tax=Pongo abelii TaxID=9601 RepID=H2NCY0_PONAB
LLAALHSVGPQDAPQGLHRIQSNRAVHLKEGPRGCQRGGGLEAVQRLPQAAWRPGLHPPQPLPPPGGVPCFPPGPGVWPVRSLSDRGAAKGGRGPASLHCAHTCAQQQPPAQGVLPGWGGDPTLGGVQGPAHPATPLIPTPPPDDPRLPQLLPAERRGLEELEVPVDPPPSSPAQEALDLLFNCESTEEASSSPARGPLTEAELALFDPFSKEEGAAPSPTHVAELAAMEVESARLDQEPWEPGGQDEEEDGEGGPTPAYLSQATELITQALRDEKAGAYAAALQGYRDGVHVLLQGVPSDPLPARQEGVKKKAAEYLKRAEEILRLHLSQLPP